MNKEQAFKNLSLPADADIETIRMRFAARYTLSDTQYDRTLTDGMKAVHEQHLRDLEQAYKVATDNPVIADMGALLSLGKGYVEENSASIGGDDTISTDEALAFFALYPHDTPVLAEQRYTQYVAELEEAMEQVGLEASKEPYRQEITRAETNLQVVINYLLASQMLASQQEETAETAGEYESMSEPEREESAEAVYAVPPASKPLNKPKFAIIGAAAIALLAIGYFLNNHSETGNHESTASTGLGRDSTVWKAALAGNSQATYQHYLDQYPNGIFAQEAKNAIAHTNKQVTAQVNEDAQKPQRQEEEEAAQQLAGQTSVEPLEQEKTINPLSPAQTIQAALDKYVPSYNSKVTKVSIEAIKEGERWFIPLSDIETINEQGQLVSKSNRPGFLFQGTQRKKTTENFKLTTAPRQTKKLVMDAIHALVSPSGSSQSATLPTTPSTDPVTETAKKEVVPTKTGRTPPLAPKKDTAESASSKPAIDETNKSKRDTIKKGEHPTTRP